MRGSFEKFRGMCNGKLVNCVEVGVSRGDNAVAMLDGLPTARFFLVDSYNVNNTTFQFGGKVFTPEEREAFIAGVKSRLTPYGDRVELVIDDSETVANKFVDDSLDYVYIDAQHETPAVLRDLKAWYPKVRTGGVIAGHDWPFKEVQVAVTQFFTSVEGISDDWFVVKKEGACHT